VMRWGDFGGIVEASGLYVFLFDGRRCIGDVSFEESGARCCLGCGFVSG